MFKKLIEWLAEDSRVRECRRLVEELEQIDRDRKYNDAREPEIVERLAKLRRGDSERMLVSLRASRVKMFVDGKEVNADGVAEWSSAPGGRRVCAPECKHGPSAEMRKSWADANPGFPLEFSCFNACGGGK